MARFDKYNGVSGGFRARLSFAVAAGDVGSVTAVGLDGNGRVVPAAAAADALGVVCPSSAMAEGDVIDVMTDGEIVDVTTGEIPGAAAGAVVYAGADGGFGAAPAAGANGTRIGHFVEAWRLVVRVSPVQG